MKSFILHICIFCKRFDDIKFFLNYIARFKCEPIKILNSTFQLFYIARDFEFRSMIYERTTV